MSSESVQPDPTQDPLIEPVSGKLEKLINMQMRFEMQTEDLFDKVLQKFDEIEVRLNMLGDQSGELTDSDQESAWEIQKRAIYAEYTNGSEPPPVAPQPEPIQPQADLDSIEEDPSNETIETIEDACDFPDPILPETHSLDENDRIEIEKIKTELREKLRQAEVELSISRAKISQEQAELDNRAREIERQAKQLDSDKAQYGHPRKKASMLERLSRHMTGSKNDDDQS